MEQIKDTILSVIQGWQAPEKSGTPGDLSGVLKKILAKKAILRIKSYNFRNGILSVKVDSSGWLYYLNIQKEELLKKIQKENNAVKNIRFYLGE